MSLLQLPPITGNKTKRHQPISAPLRRTRRRRRLLGMVFGLLAGFGLSELIAQLGSGWIRHGSLPWLGGILSGVLASLILTGARSVLRQLRIELAASRAGYLSAIAIVLVVSVGSAPRQALAQSAVGCEVSVSGAGVVGGPGTMSATAADNPLKIDPSNAASFTITWEIPENVVTAGDSVTMELWTRTLGVDNVLHQAESNDASGVYELRPTSVDIAPGVYEIWGELLSDGAVVCPASSGFIRIMGSPLSNPFGLAALGGVAVGIMGLGLVLRFPRLDLWTFTTPDGVTVEILDSTTGKTVRGPLTKGHSYTARTTVDFPDPAAAYASMPGPVDVTTAALGGAAVSLPTTSINPASGQVSADTTFTVPPVGETMELVTDLSVAGNLVQSVRVVERIGSTVDRTRVSQAVGQVIYRMGSWAADDLCSARPTDATVMMHGNLTGDQVEVWVYHGDVATGRMVARNRIAVNDLVELSAWCRRRIERCIEAGWQATHCEPAEKPASEIARDMALIELARSGAGMRTALFGDIDSIADYDGVILVAQDTEVTESATFAWPILYNGQLAHNGQLSSSHQTVCYDVHPDGAPLHEPTVVCLARFWGVAHEVAWPNGWVPTQDLGGQEAEGLIGSLIGLPIVGSPLRALLGRNPSAPRLLPNILRNRQPVRLHSIDNVEFRAEPGLAAEVTTGVTVSRSFGRDGLAHSVEALSAEAEIVHLLGHGVIADKDFALSLDRPGDPLVAGADLQQIAPTAGLTRGPLVIVNACESGAISPGSRNGLVDALRTLGARAVVVTESRVDVDEALAVVGRILHDVLAGDYVSRAVRSARRDSLAERVDLSSLAFSYYGAPGLRLANPVIDLATPPPPAGMPLLAESESIALPPPPVLPPPTFSRGSS